jgi:hypothetical protein
MKLYVCIFDDARLLPHFLKHYVPFGISEFHIAAPTDMAGYIAEKSQGYKVITYHGHDVAETVTGAVGAVTAMRMATQAHDEWVAIADLDEFVDFGTSVWDRTKQADEAGRNVVRGIMYDRLAEDGQLKSFDDNSDLASLYPVRSRMRKELMSTVDFKGVLVKGHLQSKVSHHKFHDEKPLKNVLLDIAHYKWMENGLDRIRQAYAMAVDQGMDWAWMYKRVLDHYDQHGRFAWETFGGELVGSKKP